MRFLIAIASAPGIRCFAVGGWGLLLVLVGCSSLENGASLSEDAATPKEVGEAGQSMPGSQGTANLDSGVSGTGHETADSSVALDSSRDGGALAAPDATAAPDGGKAGGQTVGDAGDEGMAGTPLFLLPDSGVEPLLYTADALVLNFSEPLDPAALTSTTVRVYREGLAVSGSVSSDENSVRFRPDVPWALGAHYAVTVTAAVTALGGASPVESTVEFTMPDGSWQPPQALADTTLVPEIDFARNGLGVLAVGRSVGSLPQMFTSVYIPGTGFGALQQLSDSAVHGEFHSRPQVAVNDAGQAVLVWQHYDGVLRAEYGAGLWSAPDYEDGSAYAPQVALSEQGRVLVALHANRETTRVMSNTRQFANAGSTTRELSDLTSGSGEPVLADADSTVAIVWSQQDAIFASRNGGSRQQISVAGATAETPAVAAEGVQGSIVALWLQAGDGWTNVWAARSVSGANWASPVQLSDGAGNAAGPVVALDDLGRGVAVWQQLSGGLEVLMGATFEPTAGWSAPQLLAEGGVAADPKLVLDLGGNGFIAFRRTVEGNPVATQVWTLRYTVPGGFAEATRLFASSVAVTGLALAVDASGRGTVALSGEQLQTVRFE